MSIQLEIMIIASLVSLSCSLVGVFLVLKKMAMMSDAITHTVLLGIVLAFFITHDLTSPWLMVGASIMGIITVYLVEALQGTRLLSEEASIGIVFPLIFSIAIVLISLYAGGVHLDTDSVLLGELAFAPLDRTVLFEYSVPTAYINSSIVLLVNIVVIKLLYKEFKIASFDAVLAATLGFMPVFLNYVLMTLVSITAVSAFNAVGSILVIAFMIGPPITANLITHDLKKMIGLTAFISVFNVILGYQVARVLDVSIAGSMASVTGFTFLSVFLFSKNGYVTSQFRKTKQRRVFDQHVILFQIHDSVSEYPHASLDIETLMSLVNWRESKIRHILDALKHQMLIDIQGSSIKLTPTGEATALEVSHSIFGR